LTVRKPEDDFGGLLLIGVGPQIKIDNDLVENFQEEQDRLRAVSERTESTGGFPNQLSSDSWSLPREGGGGDGAFR